MKDTLLTLSTEDDLEQLNLALSLGKLSGTSSTVSRYEEDLARFFRCEHAIAVSSGTAALIASLVAAGVDEHSEVVLPPTAPLMSVYSILALRAKPVFCDIGTDSFELDLPCVKNRVTKDTKAIISVPMWGYPCDILDLMQYCEQSGLCLIEDAAQSHGSKMFTSYVGTRGHFGCFSTHDRKLLPTGEGGFVLTNDSCRANAIRSFIQFGKMNGSTFGLNFKLSSLQAALGISRLPRLLDQIGKRTHNARLISNALNGSCLEALQFARGSTPNFYALVLRRRDKKPIGGLALSRLRLYEVPSETMRYNYRPLYEYPLLEEYKTDCPNAETMIASVITVPVHPGLSDDDIAVIIECLRGVN